MFTIPSHEWLKILLHPYYNYSWIITTIYGVTTTRGLLQLPILQLLVAYYCYTHINIISNTPTLMDWSKLWPAMENGGLDGVHDLRGNGGHLSGQRDLHDVPALRSMAFWLEFKCISWMYPSIFFAHRFQYMVSRCIIYG